MATKSSRARLDLIDFRPGKFIGSRYRARSGEVEGRLCGVHVIEVQLRLAEHAKELGAGLRITLQLAINARDRVGQIGLRATQIGDLPIERILLTKQRGEKARHLLGARQVALF